MKYELNVLYRGTSSVGRTFRFYLTEFDGKRYSTSYKYDDSKMEWDTKLWSPSDIALSSLNVVKVSKLENILK